MTPAMRQHHHRGCTLGEAHVVTESGTCASRPVCAADIDVEPRLKLQFAQPPNPDYSIYRRRQQKSICAGSRFKVGRRPQFFVVVSSTEQVGSFRKIQSAIRNRGRVESSVPEL